MCSLIEQCSSDLPKSILGQVEDLIEKEKQNASKLQVMEELQREATEIGEQHCRLEEASINLTTPLTSEAETSEAENNGWARPKTTSMAKVTSIVPGTLQSNWSRTTWQKMPEVWYSFPLIPTLGLSGTNKAPQNLIQIQWNFYLIGQGFL